jgi:hypothetical protein
MILASLAFGGMGAAMSDTQHGELVACGRWQVEPTTVCVLRSAPSRSRIVVQGGTAGIS